MEICLDDFLLLPCSQPPSSDELDEDEFKQLKLDSEMLSLGSKLLSESEESL